jgi:hypothetical protein
MDNNTFEFDTKRSARPNVIATFEKQGIIGWNLSMCGLLLNDWSALQEEFAIQRHGRDKARQTGDIWNAKVSAWLIRAAKKAW